MKMDMDRVPRLIEHWLGIAERSKGAYEHWMQKADCEPNPGRRAAFEAMANSEMTLRMRCGATLIIFSGSLSPLVVPVIVYGNREMDAMLKRFSPEQRAEFARRSVASPFRDDHDDMEAVDEAEEQGVVAGDDAAFSPDLLPPEKVAAICNGFLEDADRRDGIVTGRSGVPMEDMTDDEFERFMLMCGLGQPADKLN